MGNAIDYQSRLNFLKTDSFPFVFASGADQTLYGDWIDVSELNGIVYGLRALRAIDPAETFTYAFQFADDDSGTNLTDAPLIESLPTWNQEYNNKIYIVDADVCCQTCGIASLDNEYIRLVISVTGLTADIDMASYPILFTDFSPSDRWAPAQPPNDGLP